MKDINSALRSHRKPAKPEFYQLIVVVNFNQVISYRRLIENLLIVEGMRVVASSYPEFMQGHLLSGKNYFLALMAHTYKQKSPITQFSINFMHAHILYGECSK